MEGYGIHCRGSASLMLHFVDEIAQPLARQALLLGLRQPSDNIFRAAVAAPQLAPSRVCD